MEGVGLLAGGVAHDFNNILGAVLMQLELLEIEHELSQPIRQAMHDMRDAVERAANLTRQLLMFSRRQAMRLEPLDLSIVVTEMLRMLRRVIGERIEVAFIRGDESVFIEADGGMIEQVVVNLCVNARDAMPDGGRLSIATSIRVFPAESEHPGRWACLEVTDTGTGMSSDTVAHIFEPFFTTKEVGRGTGLGLATTHGIVTQHGGWIDVDTTLGVGTTFRLYLPALVNAPAIAPKNLRRPTRRGNAGVLVVEDEGLVRQMVSRSLRRLGHRVVEATTGREAIRIWADESDAIDVLVTDMVMPDGVNGVELVEELRRTNPTLRAIVMSGYSMQLSADAIPADVAFLPKPFSLAALTKAIDDTLGN
jgi:CheY-like chemotaxis protein